MPTLHTVSALLIVLAFGGITALLVALIVYAAQRAKKRRELLAGFAASRGWTYQREDPSLIDRFAGSPFDTGHGRWVGNVLRGTFDGRPMLAFDYVYRTTSTTTDSEGRTQTSEQSHPYSVVALNAGVAMPSLAVAPERGPIGRFFGRLSGTEIELESEQFNQAFRVTCPSPRFASDVLHPRMMELLMQWPALAWRFDADTLLSIGASSQTPQDIDAKLACLDAILDNIPDFVWQQVRGQR